MEKPYTCPACSRPISHRGFCLPCNKNRKASGTKAGSRKIEHNRTVCPSCGFSAHYTFIRCPECGVKADDKAANESASSKLAIDLDAVHGVDQPLFPDTPGPRLAFPFNSVRPVQQEMINDVASCLSERKHLIADAPTGLGKTAAVLFPALQYALDNDKTVFFLTSRLSQHRAAVETLRLIKNAGANFRAVDIIGKKHLCSHDVVDMDSGMFSNFCQAMVKEKRCAYYKNASSLDTAGERAGLVRLISTGMAPDESMRLASARYCTYELLMDAARFSSVIIGDYFHLFGMGDRFLKRMGKNISDAIIIVDEAHNLSSRLRDYMSSTLSTRTCNYASKEASEFDEDELAGALKDISKTLTSLAKKSLLHKNESFILRNELMEKIGGYDNLIDRLTELGRRVLGEKKISYSDRIADFLHAWKRQDIGYARILSRESYRGEHHIVLRFSCLDPSLIARDIISSSHSTILMSGTLRPVEMHRDLLGLVPDRTLLRSYSSPFPPDNRLNVIVNNVTTRYTERTPAKLSHLASKISSWLLSIRGNAAVFFPSYKLRDELCSKISTDKHIILEKSTMTKKDRDGVKDELHHHSKKGAVLFAVMGGSFAEGIDLPGDLLNGVIVVGLPLDVPDLSVAALIDYYEKRFARGRDYGYNFPAMIKVMQAAGRCIRTETDRGVVIFADERFLWDNYRKIFPEDWEFTVTDKAGEAVKEFFN